jgi:hypothetical protein
MLPRADRRESRSTPRRRQLNPPTKPRARVVSRVYGHRWRNVNLHGPYARAVPQPGHDYRTQFKIFSTQTGGTPVCLKMHKPSAYRIATRVGRVRPSSQSSMVRGDRASRPPKVSRVTPSSARIALNVSALSRYRPARRSARLKTISRGYSMLSPPTTSFSRTNAVTAFANPKQQPSRSMTARSRASKGRYHANSPAGAAPAGYPTSSPTARARSPRALAPFGRKRSRGCRGRMSPPPRA